mgnify:CR=1 FL=1
MKNVNDYVDIILAELNTVKKGKKFIVKDFFRGIDWNEIPIGVRLNIGSAFLVAAQSETNKKIIKILPKNSANQQMYQKK